MADNYKTVTRILEMYGSEEWLEATLANSRIPIQGVKQFKDGTYIKSGIIMWQPTVEMEQQVDNSNGSSQQSPEMQKALDAAKTVIFKRPGE